MKLLIATGIYPPEIGGPAGYVKGVAVELAKQGHEVAVVTYGDEKTENTSGYQVVVARRTSHVLRRYFEYFWQAYKLARKADLVYAQGPVSEGLPSALASMLARKPLVLKVVGDYAWEQAQQRRTSHVARPTLHPVSTGQAVAPRINGASCPTSEIRGTIGTSDERRDCELLDEFVTHRHKGKVWLMEAVERWVAGRAKTIIVPSKYLKTIVRKWGIESDKIKVVYNSIAPLPEIPLNLPLARETSELVDSPLVKGGRGDLGGTKLILTAVRAVPWKGGDFLCDVIKDLPEEYVLAVAGDGPELLNWKKHAEDIGVAERVRWLGRLSRAELTEWYHQAHLFVLATGYEGFPHVVVEAASTGLPCIVSDKGGNPEIAEIFPGLVTVAGYLNKQAWVEAIKSSHPVSTGQAVARRSSYVGLPEVLGFERMVTETISILSSHVDAGSFVIPAEAGIQGRDSNHDKRQRILSISLDRKLFEPGEVRDRIVGQLKDFEATIIVFGKQKFDEQVSPNVRVISTHSGHKIFYVWDAIRIAWKLRNTGIKVVVTQDPVETGLVGAVSARLCLAGLAVQDHGYHFHGRYYRQESFINRFRYWFAKWLVGRADAIRVVSQRTEDALVNLGIPQEKIIRFPLTLNSKLTSVDVGRGTPRLRSGQACDVRRATWDERRGYFLLVCRFVPIKRIDLAIHAFSLLAKKNSDVKLKIVGQGPLQDQVEKWIVDFELQDRVELMPWTNNLSSLYGQAIATLITSDGEGFGMTAVESLMSGTPVIMTDVGCAREVVKHGENGYIVPVGDVHGLASAMEVMLQNRLPVSQPELGSEKTFGEFIGKALSNVEKSRPNIIE